jgi:LacI family transcriptional regulator, galactose operon repressor
MAVRMKDIAEDVGVSLVTVSKVLRNKPDVGESTRKRILQRVSELNYRPNMLARGLASGKSYTIGLIVPDLVHTFFAELAKGVSAGLRKEAYQLILASAEEEPELERQEIEHLLARGVDALLIASCQNSAASFRSLKNSTIPYVLVDRFLPRLNAHFVGIDDAAAGRMATEHLIQLGRQRIAHIGGELISTSVGRLNGYREALAANRLPFRAELVAIRSRLEEAGVEIGNHAMSDLLKLKRRPDAVFCYNDLTAVGAIRCLLANKLRVPADIAVIGCGNLRLSEYLEVPLSSIDQSTQQQGEEAATLALSLITRKQTQRAKHLLIEPKLIARDSTVGPKC